MVTSIDGLQRCWCYVVAASSWLKKRKDWHLARLSHMILLNYNVLVYYWYFEIRRGQIPPKEINENVPPFLFRLRRPNPCLITQKKRLFKFTTQLIVTNTLHILVALSLPDQTSAENFLTQHSCYKNMHEQDTRTTRILIPYNSPEPETCQNTLQVLLSFYSTGRIELPMVFSFGNLKLSPLSCTAQTT
jgi:hypothetical protein